MPGHEEGQCGDRPLQGLNINDFIEDLNRLCKPVPLGNIDWAEDGADRSVTRAIKGEL